MNQQLYAMSSFENSILHCTVVAVACKSTVQIVKLFPDGFNCKDGNTSSYTTIQLAVKGQENFSITDVCWSPNAAYDHTIAVCTSNGNIYIYSVQNFGNDATASASIKSGSNYKLDWESNPQDFRSALNMVLLFY